jgi:Protein of unknown function (DUF3800)
MRKFLFADESGDFEFAIKPNVSRYFIICTIACDTCDAGHKLLELRRSLAWNKAPLKDFFHACEEKQSVRNAVYELIESLDLRIDATILEKRKAQPKVRPTQERFYQYGWYYHLKFIAPYILKAPASELMITAASVGTRRRQAFFTNAVNDVMQQTLGQKKWVTAFWPSRSDPCLQVADYCTWAIQRKWEKQDTRSYDLIKSKIKTEFDLFGPGTTFYY